MRNRNGKSRNANGGTKITAAMCTGSMHRRREYIPRPADKSDHASAEDITAFRSGRRDRGVERQGDRHGD